MKTMHIFRSLVPTFLALAGVGIGGCSDKPDTESLSAALLPITNCGDAVGHIRQAALDAMNKEIDARIETFNGIVQGRDRAHCTRYDRGEVYAAASPDDSNTNRATTRTGTNNQEAGVDEADFVKNDGKYIYIARGEHLHIVDGLPAAATRALSKTPLGGKAKKLFVEGDRAVVYVSVPNTKPSNAASADSAAYRWGGDTECTYGYNCMPSGDGTSTKVIFFDLADRVHPRKTREIRLSGSLLSARRIGNAVHTVVVDALSLFSDLRFDIDTRICSQELSSPTAGIAARMQVLNEYEALRQQNRKRIAEMPLANVLAQMGEDGAPDTELCGGLYRAPVLHGAVDVTTVISVDMKTAARPVTASILSPPGTVYASTGALYMAVPERNTGGMWFADFDSNNREVSTLHKFIIGNEAGKTRYLASGVVRGRVLNQFSMDEHDGYLRVATTSGHAPDPKTESQLTIFTQQGADLKKTGAVEHIAPSEDIRSVRFDGKRAFVVTFKKTDPLFVFDLADPTNPRKRGELKIPGFSTYMHMLDENHLLSIGYDADDQGSFAFFNGVLLQIFDVTLPDNPRLTHRHTIGTRGSSSEALTNHLAFTYYDALKILAVPMTICEGGGGGYQGTPTFSGLMLFNVDTANGIQERGRVAQVSADAFNQTSCYNWWTDASSVVKRSLFLDRFVYSISDAVMKVQSIDHLGQDTVQVTF